MLLLSAATGKVGHTRADNTFWLDNGQAGSAALNASMQLIPTNPVLAVFASTTAARVTCAALCFRPTQLHVGHLKTALPPEVRNVRIADQPIYGGEVLEFFLPAVVDDGSMRWTQTPEDLLWRELKKVLHFNFQ